MAQEKNFAMRSYFLCIIVVLIYSCFVISVALLFHKKKARLWHARAVIVR